MEFRIEGVRLSSPKFNILVVSGVPHSVTDSLCFGLISKLPAFTDKRLLLLLLSYLTLTKAQSLWLVVPGLWPLNTQDRTTGRCRAAYVPSWTWRLSGGDGCHGLATELSCRGEQTGSSTEPWTWQPTHSEPAQMDPCAGTQRLTHGGR